MDARPPLAPEGTPKRERQMRQADALYARQGINPKGDPDDTANDPSLLPGFNAANRHYEDSHMQSHADDQSSQGQGAPHKFSPQALIASYRSRHPEGTNAPYGGDPTQAPDYVEPKGKGK